VLPTHGSRSTVVRVCLFDVRLTSVLILPGLRSWEFVACIGTPTRRRGPAFLGSPFIPRPGMQAVIEFGWESTAVSLPSDVKYRDNGSTPA